MISTVNKYLSLVKFAHTIFAMPFAMTGFFPGYGKSGPSLFLATLCTGSVVYGICPQRRHGL